MAAAAEVGEEDMGSPWATIGKSCCRSTSRKSDGESSKIKKSAKETKGKKTGVTHCFNRSRHGRLRQVTYVKDCLLCFR